jgi:hypothetical protein
MAHVTGVVSGVLCLLFAQAWSRRSQINPPDA